MVRSKILASFIGLVSLIFFGAANAQPTVLGAAQLDSVTAAGGGDYHKDYDKRDGKHWKKKKDWDKDYDKHWKKKKHNRGKHLGWCVPMNPHYKVKYCDSCRK